MHLTQIGRSKDLPSEEVSERHFCEPCGNEYMRGSPTLSAMRSLICLSEAYRSRLYDLLAAAHPEAFYDGEDETLSLRAAEAMTVFLREQLRKERIEVNDQVFEMLVCDFIGSYDFYTRRDAFNERRS